MINNTDILRYAASLSKASLLYAVEHRQHNVKINYQTDYARLLYDYQNSEWFPTSATKFNCYQVPAS
jgi:hypothetical protein